MRSSCWIARAAGLTAATASAATPPGFKDCGLVSAAPWSYHGHGSMRYAVISRGLPCALARSLVSGLTRRPAMLKPPFAPFYSAGDAGADEGRAAPRSPRGEFAWGGKAT